MVLLWCLFGCPSWDQSAIGRPKRIQERLGYKRSASGRSFTCHGQVRPAHARETLPARHARRIHRKLNSGTDEPAPDSPDLAPTPEVAFLKLPADGPSTCAIGRANDGTPVGAPVHSSSDADGLVGRTSNQNLETIADLKISANGAARIEETHEWTLSGCRNNGQNQEEWDPHNAPIRLHSSTALYWLWIPVVVKFGLMGICIVQARCISSL